MSTATFTETETRTQTELQHGPLTHIVRRQSEDKSAIAEVVEARVYGIELEALCGHRWVPQRDPKQHPLCQLCKEIYDLHGDFGDTPGRDPMDLPS